MPGSIGPGSCCPNRLGETFAQAFPDSFQFVPRARGQVHRDAPPVVGFRRPRTHRLARRDPREEPSSFSEPCPVQRDMPVTEVQEIEDTFESARRLLGVADLLSNVAAFAGLGGFSFAGGVWLQLEQTKMEKLKAATLMLATLEPPDDDIADLSDLGCGVAQAVATEAASAIAGRFAGEFGERAVAAVSIVDSVANLARGEGLLC